MFQGQPWASAFYIQTLAKTVTSPLQLPQKFKAVASAFCHRCSSGICLLLHVALHANVLLKLCHWGTSEQGRCTANDQPNIVAVRCGTTEPIWCPAQQGEYSLMTDDHSTTSTMRKKLCRLISPVQGWEPQWQKCDLLATGEQKQNDLLWLQVTKTYYCERLVLISCFIRHKAANIINNNC